MYNLIEYHPKYRDQSILLLKKLWNVDIDTCERKFRWKHESNPLVGSPLAILALDKGKVVGFRGFFAEKFRAADCEMKVLTPCDAVVDPEHRRGGFFQSMNLYAMKVFEGDYSLFLNVTSNWRSLGAYIKLGWVPLYGKRNLGRLCLGAIFLTRKKEESLGDSHKGPLAYYTDASKWLNDMHEEFFKYGTGRRRFELIRVKNFLTWRYSNPTKKYAIIGSKVNGWLRSFIAFELNRLGAAIVDLFSMDDDSAVEMLLRALLRTNRHFYLTIPEYSTPDELKNVFERNGFTYKAYLEKRLRKATYDVPLLVRPVKREYHEHDWFKEGKDLRDIRNWRITMICGDW